MGGAGGAQAREGGVTENGARLRVLRVKLRIVALGHRMPAWVAEGFADYAQRMPREFAIDLVELKPEARDRGRTVAQLLATEATRIRAACTGHRMVALDERGEVKLGLHAVFERHAQPVVTETPTFTPTPTEQAPQPNLTSTPGDGGSQNPTGSLFYFILLGGLGLISSRFFGFSV